MKILITAYYFFPINTPRAFRATELAKQFAKLGNSVEVIIPDNNYNYSVFEKDTSIKILKIKTGFLLNKRMEITEKDKIQSTTNKGTRLFKKVIRKLISPIYFDGPLTEYSYTLYKKMISLKNTYDKVISIGLPFSTHLAVGLSRKKNSLSNTYIADYGDPFSFNPTSNHKYMRIIEKYILKEFDFITIPIKEATNSYKPLKVENKLHIIPQGFNFSNIKIDKYIKSNTIKFAFAGNFYKNIRNPKILFEYLLKSKINFTFDIYTNISFQDNYECLKLYIDKLDGKIFIKPFLERKKCIHVLSTYDFLINIDNISSVQSPSKLIDYALTKRPVFNMSQNNFNEKIFEEFCNNNYQNNLLKDFKLKTYDINNICNKFLLLESKS